MVVALIYLSLVLAGVIATIILLVRARTHSASPAFRRVVVPPSPLSVPAALGLAGFLFILHGLFQSAMIIGLGQADGAPDSDVGARLVVVQSLLFHGAALFYVIGILIRFRIRPLSAFGIHLPRLSRSAGLAVLFYLVALPHVMLYGWLSRWGLDAIGHEIGMQPVLRLLSGRQPGWVYLYLIGLAVLVAPVVEEVVFRGIALPLLIQRMGKAPAVILVSLVFSAMHAHLTSFVPLFVIGAAFSLAYLRTGDLAVPILMHTVFNAVNIGLLLYMAHFL